MMREHLLYHRRAGDQRILRAFALEMLKMARFEFDASPTLDVTVRLLEGLFSEQTGVGELVRFRRDLLDPDWHGSRPVGEEPSALRLAYEATHPSAYDAALSVHDFLFDAVENYTKDKGEEERWRRLEQLSGQMRYFFVTSTLSWELGPLNPLLPLPLPVVEGAVERTLLQPRYAGYRATSVGRLSMCRPYTLVPALDDELYVAAAITTKAADTLPRFEDDENSLLLVFSGIDGAFVCEAQSGPPLKEGSVDEDESRGETALE